MSYKHLENLNPAQQEAVEHHLGPILVLAGAGTGKTRVLTRRVANLVLKHNVHPDQILAVTFTNKATDEMRHRLTELLGSDAEHLWISTFHSACLRILRNHAKSVGYKPDFVVYDTEDSKSIINNILKVLNIEGKKYKANFFLSIIDHLKNDFIAPEDYKPDYGEGNLLAAEVYELYQRELLKANAMDFSDLLFNAHKLLNDHPEIRKLYQKQLKFILVDEFQDTNLIQYQIIRHLAEPDNNLLVVGDDDQSIYAFRGADIRNILSFEDDFPNTKVVTLEQNYRSTQNILDAAFEVISHNIERKDKRLWTEENTGEKICCLSAEDEESEAKFIAEKIKELNCFSDTAIFYRTNAQSRALEEALIKEKIPYKIFGGMKFYDRKEVKDIIAYLRLIANQADNQALARIINVPRRGIGAQTFNSLLNNARDNNLSLFEAALNSSNQKVQAFCKLINEFLLLSKDATLAELTRQIIEKTNYIDLFSDKQDPKNEDRIANVYELVAIAEKHSDSENALADFLDRVALATSADIPNLENESYVSLMTLHLAKGLEFPVVFLTGMEEGLLPHSKSIDELNVDEERRLCYVGITRAMKKLFITHALYRGFTAAGSSFGFGGGYRMTSRFLNDISLELLETESIGSTEPEEEEYYDEEVWEPKKKKAKEKQDIEDLLSVADDLE